MPSVVKPVPAPASRTFRPRLQTAPHPAPGRASRASRTAGSPTGRSPARGTGRTSRPRACAGSDAWLGHDTGVSEALDHWLPDASVRTLPPARGAARRPTALWARRRAIRLADTRRLGQARRLAHPGRAGVADLPRAVPRLPVHRARARPRTTLVSGLCGRIWTLARDYPKLDGPGGVRGLGRAGHRARRVRALGPSRSTTAAPSCTPRRACTPVDTQRPPAAEGDLGGARPVRAPRRRGAARTGGTQGRGRDLECAPNGVGLGARGAGGPAADRGGSPPARRGPRGGARPPRRAERAAARRCPRAGRRSSPTSRSSLTPVAPRRAAARTRWPLRDVRARRAARARRRQAPGIAAFLGVPIDVAGARVGVALRLRRRAARVDRARRRDRCASWPGRSRPSSSAARWPPSWSPARVRLDLGFAAADIGSFDWNLRHERAALGRPADGALRLRSRDATCRTSTRSRSACTPTTARKTEAAIARAIETLRRLRGRLPRRASRRRGALGRGPRARAGRPGRRPRADARRGVRHDRRPQRRRAPRPRAGDDEHRVLHARPRLALHLRQRRRRADPRPRAATSWSDACIWEAYADLEGTESDIALPRGDGDRRRRSASSSTTRRWTPGSTSA